MSNEKIRTSHPSRPRVTVVVPTYRRNDLLAACLSALLRQTFDAYEIIVADDADDPKTKRMVRSRAAGSPVPIRYVGVTGRHGPAAARNAGWRRARAGVIAFTDDDTRPAAAWVQSGLAALEDRPDVVAVKGRTVVPLSATPTDYELTTAGLETAEFVTANCFCRKNALRRINGFDERFRRAWREDSDLYFRLLALGPVVFEPAAIVVHPVRPGHWGISVRQQMNNFYDALLFKKHPALFREKIRRGPPVFYYFAVASFAAAAVATLAGAPIVARAAWALWTFLTFRFCARRLARTVRSPRHVAEMLLTSALIPFAAIYWRLRGAAHYRVPFF